MREARANRPFQISVGTWLLHVVPCAAICAWIVFIRGPLVHPCFDGPMPEDLFAVCGTIAFWFGAVQTSRLFSN
jgi:hypothetical protein